MINDSKSSYTLTYAILLEENGWIKTMYKRIIKDYKGRGSDKIQELYDKLESLVLCLKSFVN